MKSLPVVLTETSSSILRVQNLGSRTKCASVMNVDNSVCVNNREFFMFAFTFGLQMPLNSKKNYPLEKRCD